MLASQRFLLYASLSSLVLLVHAGVLLLQAWLRRLAETGQLVSNGLSIAIFDLNRRLLLLLD